VTGPGRFAGGASDQWLGARRWLGGAAVSLVIATGSTGALAYEEATVNDGGELRGLVRFTGAVPELPPLRVNKNREVCGESKPSEALVVGADRAVRGTVVTVEGITRGKKPEGELLIDNAKCLFTPHVSAGMAGTRGRVRNSDPILHNTHGFLPAPAGGSGKVTVFNLALPNAGQVIDITKRLSKPGVIRLLCDAHTHMFGWVYVHDSPYVAVTDQAGRYRIGGIPAGKYRVTMWHEGFTPRGTDKDGRPQYEEPRTATREVTIAPKGTATLDFEIK
jgi:Carboxypeptidase regulatory-like domain